MTKHNSKQLDQFQSAAIKTEDQTKIKGGSIIIEDFLDL